MVMAIPLAGAALGGLAGWSLGFTTAGISAGWIIGSWIAGPLAGSKNNIFDPGAQELPRTNQSLRGVTIPVLFGTNRVSSQIVWQNNFHYVRSEQGGSGGKGGGSAGGGGKGGGPTSIEYEYFIDIVYHMGMPYVPVNLFKIWIGAQAVKKSSVDQINSTLSGVATAVTSSYYSKESRKKAKTTKTNSKQPELKFAEGTFFAGYMPEISSWSYLNSKIGANVAWPGTTWVGFKDLSLGPQPAIPQLQMEIGPSENAGTEWSGPAWRKSRTDVPTYDTNNIVLLNPGKSDVYDRVWSAVANLGSATGPIIYCHNKTTGNIDQSYNLKTLYSSLISTYSNFGRGSLTNSPRCTAWLSEDGTRLIALSTDSGGLFGPIYVFIGVYTIGSDGVLTLSGGISQDMVGGVNAHSTQNFVGQLGFGGLSDYLFYGGRTTGSRLHLCVAPSIEDIESDSIGLKGNVVNTYRYSTTSSTPQYWNIPYRQLNNDSADTWACLGFVSLPTTNSSTGQVDGYRVYTYFSKWYVANATADTWLPTFTSTNPDGGLTYIEITDASFIWSVVSTITERTLSDPVACGSVFIPSSGSAYEYFSDDGLDYTTGLTNTASSYKRHISKYADTSDTSSIEVCFVQVHTRDSTWVDGSNEPLFIKVRAFSYNTSMKNFHESFSISKNIGDCITVFGGSSNIRAVQIHETDSLAVDYRPPSLAIMGSSAHGQSALLHSIWYSEAFQVSLGSQVDLPPPLIIRQILVNEIFGLFPGQLIIDEVSYLTAYNYCINHDILCSTQYRREEGGQNVIELLLALYGGWLTVDSSTNTIKFGVMDLVPNPVRTIDNHRLVRHDDTKPPIKTSMSAAQDTYNLIRVNYFDRNLDYEQNAIEEGDEVDQDLNGVRLREFPPVFVMSERTAHRLALKALWSNLYPRQIHQFYLSWKDHDLEPGDLITLVDSFSNINQICQIVKWEETERGQFQVHAAQQLAYVPGYKPSDINSAQWDFINNWDLSSTYTSATSAYEWLRVGAANGMDDWGVYELPFEFDRTGKPRLYAHWQPKGEAHSAVLYVSPDGDTYARTARAKPTPLAGRLLTNLTSDPNQQYAENVEILLHPAIEWTSNSPVFYFNATLPAVTQAGMHTGAGLMWVGSEMLSYAGVTLLSQNKYRLDRVYRGWGGTVIGAHSSGDFWCRHGSGLFSWEYGAGDIGTTFYYKIVPHGFNGQEFSVESQTARQHTIQGIGYRPRLPSAIQYETYRGETKLNVGSAKDLNFYWHGQSQLSGYGAGGYGRNAGGYGGFISDIESLGWYVHVVGSSGLVVRSTYVSTPAFTYTNSNNASDNGAWRGNIAVKVLPVNPYGTSQLTRVMSMELFF